MATGGIYKGKQKRILDPRMGTGMYTPPAPAPAVAAEVLGPTDAPVRTDSAVRAYSAGSLAARDLYDEEEGLMRRRRRSAAAQDLLG